jgi:GNAT superfamily N-acetyltransferase
MSEPLAEYPKTIVLKDGTHLVLRPRASGEHQALSTLLARVPPPDRYGAEIERAEPVVLAWDGERLAGAIGIARQRPDPELGLVLDPAYRGRRLGTWMLLDAVHLAAGLGCTCLVAPLGGGDETYRAALRRLDFTEDAAGKSAAVLVKRLHAAWTDF